MSTVHVHGVWESCFELSVSPQSDVVAVITGPGGQSFEHRAFWDGGNAWRLRISPCEVGRWEWCLKSPSEDVSGQVECVEYTGENPLYVHGPLQVSGAGSHLEHCDGTPFFWLGDTAWNGVIRGDDQNWQEYLECRSEQRVNVIQYVSSHWRGDEYDDLGERACDDSSPININPDYFKRLDRRIAMINEHGLVGAPIVLWSLLKTDPGYAMPEEDALRLAKYIVARYDAHQLVWLLGGDGNYQEIGVDRWKRIGREVFKCGHNRLVSLHPCGQNWIGDLFRDEPWYDLIGYQSGHGDALDHLEWLVKGPPAVDWQGEPLLPVINMEPNYEDAHGYNENTHYDDYYVRRAAYWSLLVSPTAGLTYGHDAIWNWNFETGPSEGHGNWHDGAVPPWHTGLRTAGIESMTVMRGILEKLDWTTLKPFQDVLAEQPGEDDAKTYTVAARTASGTVVIYSPLGGGIKLATGGLTGPVSIIDPKSGEVVETATVIPSSALKLPEGKDSLVVIGKYPR